MRHQFLPLALACLLLAPAAAVAQDDSVALGCARSKLRSSGKACACVHKEWSKVALSGETPDFSVCEEKLLTSLSKAETKAIAAGGACPLGPALSSIADAILAAGDKSVSQVGRGILTPVPDACDGISKLTKYSGGNYGKMPKCVKPAEGDEDCLLAATGRKMSRAIEKDMTCPECPEDEEGCVPRVPTILASDLEARDGLCCLKDGGDSKESVDFSAKCTLCVVE